MVVAVVTIVTMIADVVAVAVVRVTVAVVPAVVTATAVVVPVVARAAVTAALATTATAAMTAVARADVGVPLPSIQAPTLCIWPETMLFMPFLFRNAPVDWLLAQLLQDLVGLVEVIATEEAAVGRETRRMNSLQDVMFFAVDDFCPLL